MARDLNLQFHGTQAAGTTFTGTDTTGTNGPTVDLGSNSVNRTILVERRIAGTMSASLNIRFQKSSDGSTFVNLPGTTSTAIIGFAVATTTDYGSTDAVAANAPARLRFSTDTRYVRAVYTIGTSATTAAGVTVVGQILSGAYSGAVGPLDS